jgi:hypothetical protein
MSGGTQSIILLKGLPLLQLPFNPGPPRTRVPLRRKSKSIGPLTGHQLDFEDMSHDLNQKGCMESLSALNYTRPHLSLLTASGCALAIRLTSPPQHC